MKKTPKVLCKRKRDLPIAKFQALFPDEKACKEHLFHIKWPNGFECPQCGCSDFYPTKRGLFQCKSCKHQSSVTAGTLFHRSHVPLNLWFWAIYLFSRDKRGCSAVALKNALNVSYPTAWLLLQKIRSAMKSRDDEYILNGIVLVDEAFFGGKTQGKKRGRGTEKTTVLFALSLTTAGNPLFVKAQIVDDMKLETVTQSMKGSVEPNSLLVSDDHKSLKRIPGFLHQVVNASQNTEVARKTLRWVHTYISNTKASLLATYHGLSDKYLQRYLDECCYRFNRRFCEHQIFGKLLKACVSSKPMTLAEITL